MIRALALAGCLLALRLAGQPLAVGEAQLHPKRGIARQVQVPYDAVYQRAKRYRGRPLAPLLRRAGIGAEAGQEAWDLVFICSDAYTVRMPLGLALAHEGHLVWKDLDAPAGRRWTPLRPGGSDAELGSWYVVWADAPAGDARFKWPYALERIRLEPRP